MFRSSLWFAGPSKSVSLQQAATFIAATHKTIEESFSAVDLVANLRQEARRLPSSFVSDRAVGDEGLAAFREEFGKLDERIQSIRLSQASRNTMLEELRGLNAAFETLRSRLAQAEEALEDEAVDMDGLLSHALFLDRSLMELTAELNELSRNLRVQLQSAVDHEREVHNRPVIAGIAIGGLSVLMLLIFTWLVVDRYFIARVTTLSKALLSIANGDLRATLPEPTGNDEVDEMARTVRTFRLTAQERDQLLAEASQAAERLEREVAERTAELENANQYKTRFLAIASHDLRQPLHALNLFIEQIRNSPKPKRRQQLEGRISEAVSSISELLDALLDMSKLEAGVMTPDVTSFPINCVRLVEVILPRLTEGFPKNIQHSTPITPLRARMIADMTARTLGPASQTSHLRACKRFAAWLGRSPDTATAEDVKQFQLHLMETGTSICTRNQTMTGVEFLFV